ncbi:hypothetical protein ACFL17_07820 [Pseudomonadota bacterium]
MKLSTLMVNSTIVAGPFGIGLVVLPEALFSLYGVTTNLPLNYVGQLFGGCLIMIALLAWGARNATNSVALRAIVLSFFVGDTIGFCVALFAQLGGVVNALGWSTVLIYFLLALGYGYFHFSKTEPR